MFYVYIKNRPVPAIFGDYHNACAWALTQAKRCDFYVKGSEYEWFFTSDVPGPSVF